VLNGVGRSVGRSFTQQLTTKDLVKELVYIGKAACALVTYLWWVGCSLLNKMFP